MANLVITVIAIALVAVASLIGIYYGGSAYLQNQYGAFATTTMQEGAQIAGAWQAYLGDNLNVPPTADVGQLVSKGYLAQWPRYPVTDSTGSSAPYLAASVNGHYYVYAVVGTAGGSPGATDPASAACVRIIRTATGQSPGTMNTMDAATLAAGGAGIGSPVFGCGLANSPGAATVLPNSLGTISYPAGTVYLMYYKLG